MMSERAVARVLATIALVVGLGIALVRLPLVVAVFIPVLVALGALALTGYLCHDPDPVARRTVMKWALGAFAAHILIGLAISDSASGVRYFGGDAATYHGGAVALLEYWEDGAQAPLLPAGKEGFFYLLAGLYYVFGSYTVVGLVANAAFSAALVLVTADTTRRLFGPAAARRVVPLIVLLPGFLVWTSQLLREAAILCFIAVAANCAVRLSDRLRLGPLLGLVLALVALFTFRGNVAYMVAAGLLIGIVLARRRLVAAMTTSGAAFALLALVVVVMGIGYSGYRLSADADLDQVQIARTDSSSSAESGFAPEADVSTGNRAFAFLPVAVPQLLLGPFPWQVDTGRQFLGLVEAAILWTLVPSAVRGLRLARRRVGRRMLVLVLPAVLLTIMLSLLIGNYGTTVRERLQVVVLLLPFVAFGLAERRRPAPGPVEAGTTEPATT